MSKVNSTHTQPISTRLRPHDAARLRARAEAEGTTLSSLLARVALRYLKAAA